MTTDHTRYAQSHTWNEITSQARVWQTVLDELHNAPATDKVLAIGQNKNECIFVGCGTSFYLAEAAALSWTLLTGQAARPIPASEILLYPKLLQSHGVQPHAIVISRSGRTSEAVRAANVLGKDLHIPTVGITCAGNSELERACDLSLVLPAADEQSTVMTRSFTSMLLTLQLLAAARAQNHRFVENLGDMAKQFSGAINEIADRMERFVTEHTFADYVFLGQGPFHGIAREAALKVMEMSCSYSQFFHALEFRHGPKAIVSPATCLTFFLSERGQEAEAEVLGEMKELGGVIVAVCNRADMEIRKSADLTIELNFTGNELALLAPYIVPCQLMGFFTGLRKGLNPDQPKNLSRVVILD
jgi:glucosamine--fructose-6-phosphate aminotransferase (isomerizing)